MRALYEAGFRGSPAVWQILHEWSTERSEEVNRLRNDIDDLRKDLKQAVAELRSAEVTVAALNERLRGETTRRHLKNLALTAGTALVALALDLNARQLTLQAVISAVLGVTLVVLGAWPILGHDEVDK